MANHDKAPASTTTASAILPSFYHHNRAKPLLTSAIMLLADAGAVALCWMLALTLFNGGAELTFSLPTIGAAVVMGMMTLSGLYAHPWARPQAEFRAVVLGCAMTMLLFLAVSLLFLAGGIREGYPAVADLPVIFLACLVSSLLVPWVRSVLRRQLARENWWGQPVLVIADQVTCVRQLVGLLQRHSHIGLRPVLVVNDCGTDRKVRRVPSLCAINEPHRVIEAVEYLRLSQMVLASSCATQQAKSVITMLDLNAVQLDPTLFELSASTRRRQDLTLLMDTTPAHRGPASEVIKRAIDITLGTTLFLIALPVMVVIAILIKLESRGDIVFRQKRPGRHRRSFRILKFRTMRLNAQREFNQLPAKLREEFEKKGKIDGDPRITRMGRFLRKTSLDELPQLWNVIRGDMSLVGPRAYVRCQMGDIRKHGEDVLNVRPGITGLWQVCGRNEVTTFDRIKLDRFYVRRQSLWLDLLILVRTVGVVLWGRGAT